MLRTLSRATKLFLFVACILSGTLPSLSEDRYPVAEIFGGYAYSTAGRAIAGEPLNGQGWGIDITGQVKKHFGITADISGQYGNVSYGDISVAMHQFLFGPRFRWSSEKLTGYVHLLAGANRLGAYDMPYKEYFLSFPADTRFAMGFGGGLDIAITKRIAIRAPKVDYIPVRTRPDWTHILRVQAGVVIRLGTR